MDGHPLVKLAYVLYWVLPTIIYSKSGLVEPPRKLSPLYPTHEGRLGDAVQGLTHGVVWQALVRWAFVAAFARLLFLVGKGFTWRGSRSPPVLIILLIASVQAR